MVTRFATELLQNTMSITLCGKIKQKDDPLKKSKKKKEKKRNKNGQRSNFGTVP